MKFLHKHHTLTSVRKALPSDIPGTDKEKILIAMIHFTDVAEEHIQTSTYSLTEDALLNAILQFNDENKEVSHQRLFPDFDEDLDSGDERVRFEKNVATLFMLLKQFWFYHDRFELCLKKYTTAEGLGAKQLFVSALNI